MTIKVIGAGFGRTGTTSLKQALEILGFGPCHHAEVMMKVPGQVDLFHHAAMTGEVDLDQLFQGYQSVVDWPGMAYWKELANHSPDAKVILSTRSPESWYKSVSTTIYKISKSIPGWLGAVIPKFRKIKELTNKVAWDGQFEGRFEDKSYALRRFEEHTDTVKASIPEERLLVHQATDGWEPLCAFLGVPVPEQPYPHANDSSKLARVANIMVALNYLPILVATILLVIVLGAFGWLPK